MVRRTGVLLAAVLLAATACSSKASSNPSSSPGPSTGSNTSPGSFTSAPTRTSPPATPTSAAPVSLAQGALNRMTLAERVGQLLMVDCPSTQAGQATNIAVGVYHVGSVILDGTSYLSTQQTSQLVTLLAQRASPNVGLFVATDQEGGQVQRLQGPGFSSIPSAVQQGQLAPAILRQQAQQWGAQLHAAGINVDLAPVLDTVPLGFGSNPPIGDLDREYGHDPAAVSSHGTAVALGLQTAGVAATAKHFPGLGRVTGNTDLTAGVLDAVTTHDDPYLAPFADAVGDGVQFVMISTAIYTKIDPTQPAAFSPTIITGMLRDDLRFRGVIISDDVGISKQLSGTSVADRAVKFIAAGGDIVLTVDATQAPTMSAALLARANSDPAFKRQVDAAALVVLQAKQSHGLLH